MVLDVILAVVTLATAIKDMVELAESIHASFEKVSDNLRNAQVLAGEMKQTIDELKVFYEQHSATLENDQDLRDALLALIAKLRQFDSEIVPLITSPTPSPRLLSRVKGGFKAWRNVGHIEASIRQLKKDVKKCERNFVMMSVARMQVKLNALQSSSNEGLQVMKQVSDVLITRNTLSFAHSSSTTSQRLTAASNQRVVAFAQTSSSTSTPIWKAPSVMQARITRDAYLKAEINCIANLLSDLSTHVMTYSIEPLEDYTNPFTIVVGGKRSSAYCNPERMHRDVVMQALQIRETLENVSVSTSIQEGAWRLINLAGGLYDAGMYEEAVKMNKWAANLLRMLVNVHEAIYSPYLVRSLRNLSLSHTGAGNNNDAFDAIQEAVQISKGLQTPTAPLEIQVQYGGVLLLYAMRMSDIKKDHKRAIELAEQSVKLMEDINGVDLLPQSYEKVNGIVEVSRHFLTQLYQVSPSEMALAQYARALQTLSNCLMANNQRQESLDTKLRALPIFYHMASRSIVDTDDELAEILHELNSREYNFLLPAEKAREYAEDCVRIYRRYAELNPFKYGQLLCNALYRKGLVLNRLSHDTDALEVWKELANIAQQMIQDQESYADVLNQLSQSFHRLKRHEESLSAQTQLVLIYEAINNTTTAEQATANYNLCIDYRNARRFPEAVEAAKKAVKQYRVLAFVEPDKWTGTIGDALTKLADSHFSAGDHKAALNEGHQSMQIFERHIKTDPECIKSYLDCLKINWTLATTVNNGHMAIERMDDVLQHMHQLAVDRPERISSWILKAELDCGYNLFRLDHVQKARQYMDELIAKWEGEGHPHVHEDAFKYLHIGALITYANILANEGHTDLALMPLRKGGDIGRRSSAPDPYLAGQTVRAMYKHAHLLLKLGEYEEASVAAEGTLKFSRETQMDSSSHLVGTLHVVGLAAHHIRAYSRVVQVSQEAVDICNGAGFEEYVEYCWIDPTSFSLLSRSLQLLSSGHANSGDLELGLQYGQEAVDAAKAVRAEPRIPSALVEQYYMEANSHLGAMYLANNRIDEACRTFEETRAYYTEKVKVRPGQSGYLISMLHQLGTIYCSEGKHDEGYAAAQEVKEYLGHLAEVLPGLHEQVHIAMRHESTTPSLQVLNKMKETLSCNHQSVLSF